ncbi:hypothetical protein EJ05DRAFT_471460 [Pseudovirgaria hyperparasitica]|uniref:Opioid growth factor receptor (OGFr) conserved domain-containing protein n=1 Tax=Pseudovirgaria hyperparasitica TaxID=470096 RepID=A0A6A6WJI8_9PEZI|nr:uncharacterized protein EJ05DRAFT_471460 [Pseudovirgaria hyperparasitica]KAF2762434.1 hypothetical protein EJ05DRAFT_471460 [Pseudovirgaria hyperparasitica]
MAPNATSSFIIRFYDPEIRAPDTKDRDLDDILEQSDQWFEACHDYVQILFPLPEESMFNYFAPTIERDTFDGFRSRPELRAEMRKAFTRMLAFYGFELHIASRAESGPHDSITTKVTEQPDNTADNQKHEKTEVVSDTKTNTNDEDITIVKAPTSARRFQNWVMRFNHNHLRITRILRSLRVLGLTKEADAFFAALESVQAERGKFSDTSLKYWRRAVEQPLWVAPDGEKIGWLQGLEDESQ